MTAIRYDEEKRSKLWRLTITITSIVIIVVSGYFLYNLFTSNPLEGTWISEDTNMNLTIKGNDTAIVKWPEISEASNVKIKIEYMIDKEDKTIKFTVDDALVEEAVKNSDGRLTKPALDTEISLLETTFDYSMEGTTLILTEREYGEQLVFIKK